MIYRFDRYELDDETFELLAEGQPVRLAGKSFDLLRYLLENSRRVVTKRELFREIWRDEHVTESVLPVNVRKIRSALGDEASEAILKTVRGRGYRIICDVSSSESASAAEEVPDARSGFVGREPLMSSLRTDYEAVMQGEGRVILLYGEAGIGKTRVLDEFAHWSRGRSAMVLSTRCPEHPGAPPLWPVLQLLRAGDEALASDEFRTAFARSDLDLAALRARLKRVVRANLAGKRSPGSARFRLAEAVVRLVEQVSQITPLVLIVDDLQGADEGTLFVCEAVTREVPRHAVMALGAYNNTELRRGSTLSKVMGAISSQASLRQVRLRGLGPDEVETFVHDETGLEPPQELVPTLHERTEGNPFFLRETLRLLVAEGGIQLGLDPVQLGLPQGIREAIGRRLDHLSQECNQVLVWASVVGRRFSFPVLEQISGFTGRRLLELLAEAEEAHILSSASSERGLALGEFAFAHGLIRETIYEGISGPERVLRHRGVAEALEALYGGGSGDRVFELARHFFEAAPGGDVQRASEYSLQAAREAGRRFAHPDVIRHLDHALRAEDLRIPRDDLRYCFISMARANALWRTSKYAGAQAAFMAAADLARELGRFDLLGHCALGMLGWPRFSSLEFAVGDTELGAERISALVQEALGGLDDSQLALRSRLLGVLSRGGAIGDRSLQHAEEAVAMARASGDREALFHALITKVAALAGPFHVSRALELASEAVGIATELAALPLAFTAYEARAPLLLALGDMARADDDIRIAARIAGRIRTPACEYAVARFQLARALGDGDRARATELSERVLELGPRSGDHGAWWASQAVELWSLAAQGDRAASRPIEGADDPDDPGWQAFSAYLCTLAGDREGSRRHFERAAEDAFSRLPLDTSWLWNLCGLADTCAFLGDAERAAPLYDLLAPHSDLNAVHAAYLYRGSTAVPLGRLAWLMGRRDEALELLEAGLELNERIGARYALAWTQFLYASMLKQGNSAQRRHSQSLLREVERCAKELEMAGLIHRAEGV